MALCHRKFEWLAPIPIILNFRTISQYIKFLGLNLQATGLFPLPLSFGSSSSWYKESFVFIPCSIQCSLLISRILVFWFILSCKEHTCYVTFAISVTVTFSLFLQVGRRTLCFLELMVSKQLEQWLFKTPFYILSTRSILLFILRSEFSAGLNGTRSL